MKNSNYTRNVAAVTGLICTALIVGCQPIAHGEKFYGSDDVTNVGKIAQAQAAAGAKDDAMLYDKNFHGTELNSLGEGKLDLIVKGTPDGDPVYVYLNMPHDQVALRQAAVTAYLKTAGVADTKIIVAEGSNPNPSTPTAYNLGGLYKADGASFNGQAAVDADAAGGAAGGGAAGGGH
jgi:hypothetical protein